MRKAGELLREVLNKAGDFDAAYAQKIENFGSKYSPNDTVRSAVGMGAAVPIRDMSLEFDTQDTLKQKLMFGAMYGGIGASNVGIRYGIPLAGGYAAMQGIGGLMNQPVDQTNPPVGY